MLSRIARYTARVSSSIAFRAYTVAVCGANGGVGQPLSLLLKLNSHITQLNLFDIIGTFGVSVDISHICSPTLVKGYMGMEDLNLALEGCNLVIITAGITVCHFGMSRNDLFNTNALIVENIATVCAKICPKAVFLIIANPVNSTVPIFAEVMKKHKVYDSRKVIGVTTLDIVRANTFVAANQRLNISKTNVPVIGGHEGNTILPLLSQVSNTCFTHQDIDILTKHIQFGGYEIVKAKGTHSATLSMAYAAHRFTSRLLEAMTGEPSIYEYAFVANDITKSPFFSTKVRLGPNGIEEVLGFGQINDFEQKCLKAMIPDLISQVAKGVEFVNRKK